MDARLLILIISMIYAIGFCYEPIKKGKRFSSIIGLLAVLAIMIGIYSLSKKQDVFVQCIIVFVLLHTIRYENNYSDLNKEDTLC